MMAIFTTLLTIVLVINCLLLILLVLIQLPKKDAGAGLAFGGGTTDALFGAGSGNALTQLTKYSAMTFMLLSVSLGVLNARAAGSTPSAVREQLAKQKAPAPAPAAQPAASPNQFQNLTSTNLLVTPAAVTATTNIAPSTSQPALNTNAAAPK